jgi:hypothetical protein
VNLELRIALERLVYLNAIRGHVLGAFELASNRKVRIKHSEITRYVAQRIGREFSPALGRDVLQAMTSHGWRPIKHSCMYWWRGVKRK